MKSLLCAAFLLAGPLSLLAQDEGPQSGETHRVHLRNGQAIYGILLKQTHKEVLLSLTQGDTLVGGMSIRYDQVKRFESVKEPSPKPPDVRGNLHWPLPGELLLFLFCQSPPWQECALLRHISTAALPRRVTFRNTPTPRPRIHTFAGDRFVEFFPRVEPHADGEWWEV